MRISDWSSDVCSSDLQALPAVVELAHDQAGIVEGRETNTDREIEHFGDHVDRPVDALEVHGNRRVRLHETRDETAELELQQADRAGHADHPAEHGRASGRARGCQYVENSWVAGSVKKTQLTKKV